MVTTKRTSTTNLEQSRLSLDEGVVFVPQLYRGATFYHLETSSGERYYRIGYSEYVFVSLLDGTTTFAEALAISSQTLGAEALSTERAMRTYVWLLDNGIGSLEGTDHGIKSTHSSTAVEAIGRLNPFWLKVPLGNPDQLIKALQPIFGWLFSGKAVFGSLILLIIASLTFMSEYDRFVESCATVFAPTNWLWLGLMWIALKFVHELAHGIASRRLGCAVPECGLVFVLFAPLAYVDVTPSWSLTSKWQRIKIAAAGIYFEFLIAACAIIIWAKVDSPHVSHLLVNLIVMATVSTFVFNVNPLMRFDGYFILSDLLEIPNLYADGAKLVKSSLRRFFFGEVSGDPVRVGSQIWLTASYGLLAAVWRILICVSLVIAATMLFHGAGILLAAIGILAWVGSPMLSLFQEMTRRFRGDRASFFRSTGLATSIGIIISIVLAYAPPPHPISAPGVVEYRDVAHVRSLVAGFVSEVVVNDGDFVRRGDLLLRLVNRDVYNAYHDLRLSIKQTKLRRRIALDERQIADAQVEQRNLDALNEQLVDASRRYHALSVRAPNAGKIVNRLLPRMVGTFVGEGEQLLSIGDDRERQVVLFVAQSDLKEMIPALGTVVTVRDSSCFSYRGKLERITPRASTKLSHAALASTEGGPLMVAQTEANDGVELIEPRIKGTVTLDKPGGPTGQRCRVFVHGSTDSIGRWLWNAICELSKD